MMKRKHHPKLRAVVFKHRSTKRNHTRQQAKQSLRKESNHA